MRPLRALGIYAVTVFVGGALLAPWNYWLMQSLARVFPYLASSPFERYVTTSMMMIALAALWPFLRALGTTSLRETGLVNPLGHGKELLGGLVLGVVSLSVIAALALAFGARELSDNLTAARLLKRLAGAAFTAAGVAIIEETLFRGGIFGGLRRVLHWPFALTVSSVIYSLTHFIEDTKFSGTVTWSSGLQSLPGMFGGDSGLGEILPRFLNLTVAGALLALAFQRKGNLWFSIGLHAGWVFCLFAHKAVTQSVPGAMKWFWGGGRMIDGWLAFAVLATTLALAWRAILPGFKNPCPTQ